MFCSDGSGLTARLASVLPVVLLALGCGPSPVVVLDTKLRLVPAWDETRDERWSDLSSTMTIGSETRPVLNPRASAMIRESVRLESRDRENETGTLELPLPRALRNSRQLLLAPHVRRHREEPWQTGNYQLVTVQRQGEDAFVRVSVKLPQSWEDPGDGLLVSAAARTPPGHPIVETLAFDVPRAGELQLGFAPLPGAEELAAFELSAEICEGDSCTTLFDERLDPRDPESRRWHDRTVSLDAWAGRRVSLRFWSARETGLGEVAAELAWSQPIVLAPAPQSPERPNILLVSLDTLAAGHLPSYGYQRPTAPHLDELARRGTLFEQAIAAAPTTGPSHMTLFTSLQPSVHRIVGLEGRRPLAAGARTLAQTLRDHGLATAAFTENGAILKRAGFTRGFDVYVENAPATAQRFGSAARRTFSRAMRWLEKNRGRRFFLFVHTYQVHAPHEAPVEYVERFATGDPAVAPGPASPDAYDAEIAYTDDLVHDLLRELRARGLLDNTLVVLTADHGEAFLEHGYVDHRAAIHDEVLRVPLVFVGPGVARGQRVATPIGLVDLAPTLLELAGAPPLPDAMGRSFASVVRGAPPDPALAERPIFSETSDRSRRVLDERGRISPQPIDPPTLAVRVGTRKLIRLPTPSNGIRFEYYDLADDPGERRNLYPARGEAAADLSRLLELYPLRMSALREKLTGQEPGTPTQSTFPNQSEDAEFEPEREQALRALGYIE